MTFRKVHSHPSSSSRSPSSYQRLGLVCSPWPQIAVLIITHYHAVRKETAAEPFSLVPSRTGRPVKNKSKGEITRVLRGARNTQRRVAPLLCALSELC